MKPPALTVPVFVLYGDPLVWPTPDLLHCESIPQRSRLHRWEIQLHRHADLAQLLYVRKGWAELNVDGQLTRVEEAAIQVVPALCIHGFRFSENIDGFVVTLAMPLVARLQEHLGGQSAVFNEPGLYRVGQERRYIDTLFAAINNEYNSEAPARDLLLQSLIGVLAVWLGRQVMVRDAQERPERGQAYLSRFAQLVEAHFTQHWAVERYARQLGITPAYLNGLCRRLRGQTALGVLHQRLLLEAKRNLLYTGLTVNEIADLLGFSEPAYFTRFFKRLAGVSPTAFRQASARG
ncbi:helix-turn-helix domain-containing protein [Pseudomonas duriflava]|uniref:helix-turn-helix domain-containing protein n=1 Tax=Pseudomonas duriflava TaxID=459528 RepID=UPI00119FA56F|nr:helix-turn-helix domain-containing protein [Pseudomonas duriflava]